MGWNWKGMYWYEYGMDVYQQRLLFTCATYCLALLIEGLINLSCDDGKESIDDWILIQWPRMMVRNMEQTKWTLKIQLTLNGMEWNEMCKSMQELLLDFGKISENGRNIYEWNQVNQTIHEIVFDLTFRNESDSLTFWRFWISK